MSGRFVIFRELGPHEYPKRAVYRYRVANPGLRFVLNRYGWRVIGAGIVWRDWAYCVKWANA